jgi:hypothetical protein
LAGIPDRQPKIVTRTDQTCFTGLMTGNGVLPMAAISSTYRA